MKLYIDKSIKDKRVKTFRDETGILKG